MDETHLGAALRYVALNTVRARLTQRAADWRWSSLSALLTPDPGDGLTTTGPVLSRYPDFAGLIAAGEDEALSRSLRRGRISWPGWRAKQAERSAQASVGGRQK